MIPDPRLVRFMSHVDQTLVCWEWLGSQTAGGYGQFTADGRQRVAHRWLYEFFKGPVPTGLELDHLCRNRACVRVDHLEAVTRRENIRRGVSHVARQMAQTECIRGHAFAEYGYVSCQGKRRCRICDGIRDRKYRARLGASA